VSERRHLPTDVRTVVDARPLATTVFSSNYSFRLIESPKGRWPNDEFKKTSTPRVPCRLRRLYIERHDSLI